MLLHQRILLLIPFVFTSSQLKPSALPPNWHPQMEEKAREESTAIAARKAVLSCTPMTAAIFDYLTYKDLLRLKCSGKALHPAIQAVAMRSQRAVVDAETGEKYVPLMRWLKSLPPEKVTKELAKALTHKLTPWLSWQEHVPQMIHLWHVCMDADLPSASMFAYIVRRDDTRLPTLANTKLHGLCFGLFHQQRKMESLKLNAPEGSSQEFLQYMQALYDIHRIVPTLTHMYSFNWNITPPVDTKQIFGSLPRLYEAVANDLRKLPMDENVFEAQRLLSKLVRIYRENVRHLVELQTAPTAAMVNFAKGLTNSSKDPDDFYYPCAEINSDKEKIRQLCQRAETLKLVCEPSWFSDYPLVRILRDLNEWDKIIDAVKPLSPSNAIALRQAYKACEHLNSVFNTMCAEPDLSNTFRLKIVHEAQRYLEALPRGHKQPRGYVARLVHRAKYLHQLLTGMPPRMVVHLQIKEMEEMLREVEAESAQYYINYDDHMASVRQKVEDVGELVRHFKALIVQMNELDKEERIAALETIREKILKPLDKYQEGWASDRYSAAVLIDMTQKEIQDSTSLKPLIHIKPAPAEKPEEKENAH